MTFSNKILIGLGTGVALGVFLGERAAALKWAADGFVKLLQMTVLPYVTVSIIGSLGALRAADARRLGVRAGAVVVALWLVALTFAMLIPLTFPRVENAAFFSTTLIESRPPFNFVDLYIPANPFNSLANNVVPAVVLFSIILGVAVIGLDRKAVLLDPLRVAGQALSRATHFVVGLTPYGIFAIAATAAGTLIIGAGPGRERLPDAQLRTVQDLTDLFEARAGSDVDAFVLPAERGSAWTLMYPQFSVVVPEPDIVKVPLAYPVARNDQVFASFINTWIALKRDDGTIDALYKYWVLGQNAIPQQPRWSIVRNVLHWVD